MKVKLRGKDLKICELTFSRDLFGHILMLGQEQSISLQHVMACPLTPVPLSLAHFDGSMCATDKAALVHKLESRAIFVSDVCADTVIIDFMFMLRSEAQFLPMKYGEIARHLLIKARSFGAKTIFMVCDVYNEKPSIKDACRSNRGRIDDHRNKTKKLSPDQNRPTDLNKALQSDKYKNALFSFLASEWMKSADLINGYSISFAQECCYTYTVSIEYNISRIHSKMTSVN